MTSKIEPGDQFGTLTVIRRSRPNYALCECVCGKVKEVQIGKLTCKWTKSCGCLQKQRARKTANARNQKKRQSMIGRIFDRLTVVAIDHWEPDKKKRRRYFYKVRCHCGTEKVVMGCHLTSRGTKSCGCLKHEGHPGWNKLPEGEASFRSCYRAYKTSAKQRNLPFELTHDQFRKLVTSNCAYCGSAPNNTSKHKLGNGNFVYSGLDRIDNRVGYTLENSTPCCRLCNVAKNNRSKTEFLAWIKRVALHQNMLFLYP